MKKGKIIIVVIVAALIVFAIVLTGCDTNSAIPSPTPVVSAEPEPTAVATIEQPEPTPTPDTVVLGNIPKAMLPDEDPDTDDTGKVIVPDAYTVVEDKDGATLPDNIPFRVYSFIDVDGNTHYRAFGYRTGADSMIYDIGFYEITIENRNKTDAAPVSVRLTASATATPTATQDPVAFVTGTNGIVVMFDPVNAKPVDLEAEKETYASIDEDNSNGNSNSGDNGKSTSSNSGSKTSGNTGSGSGSGSSSGSGSGGSNPTPTSAPTSAPTPEPTSAPTPAPTSAPAPQPGDPGYLPPVMTPPPEVTGPPPTDWGNEPPPTQDF